MPAAWAASRVERHRAAGSWPRAARRSCARGVTAIVLLLACAAGCATPTWEQRIAPAQRAYYGGDPQHAAEIIAARLEDEAGGPDAHVLRLELASALAAADDFAGSAREYVALDDQLEVLDYSDMPVFELAAFLFSVNRTEYGASRPERLALNTLNLLNFLALGDWEGAAVEARRLRVLMLQGDLPEDRRYASALAWQLAGVALQLAGRSGEAEDCFRAAGSSDLAVDPPPDEGTVLVVVQNGKAPMRVEAIYRLLFDNGLHRLQVPALVWRPSPWQRAVVLLDGQPVAEAPVLLDLGAQLRAQYDRDFPRMLAAAAFAAAPRVVAGQAVEREVSERKSKHIDDDLQQVLAQFSGFFTEELLADALPADTRCWSLLPADVRALRLHVPAGTHDIAVDLIGPERKRLHWSVSVQPRGFALVNAITALDEGWQPSQEPRTQDLTHQPAGLAALNMLQAALAVRAAILHDDHDHDDH